VTRNETSWSDELWTTRPPRFRNIVAGRDLGEEFRYDSDWVLAQLQTHPRLKRHAKFLTFPEDRPENPYTRALDWSSLADGAVVLDYGCGIAWASALLKRKLPRLTYIGADTDRFALAAASALYPEADHLYRVEAEAPDLLYLRDDSVDLIILSLITVYTRCREFFADLERVLRPGGHLHIETHKRGQKPAGPERSFMADRLDSAFDTVRLADGDTHGNLSEFGRSAPKFRRESRRNVPCRLVGTFRLKGGSLDPDELGS
jgi:SAM-dependent methyltransferase